MQIKGLEVITAALILCPLSLVNGFSVCVHFSLYMHFDSYYAPIITLCPLIQRQALVFMVGKKISFIFDLRLTFGKDNVTIKLFKPRWQEKNE